MLKIMRSYTHLFTNFRMFYIVVLFMCGLLSQSAFVLAQTPPVWADFESNGGIAYLLRKSPTQIMRYDLQTETWLAPLPLAQVPSTFGFDDQYIYFAFGDDIHRMDKTGANSTPIGSVIGPVIDLMVDGNLLFVNHSAYTDTFLTVIDKQTFEVKDEWDFYRSLHGSSIAPSVNKIFGRSSGLSPSDISYASYDNLGVIIKGADSPYHGDYPTANKTWVFPDDNRVVDSSGTVYLTADLTYNNSFATVITDISFYGQDIPIVLIADELISFSNTLLETGRFTLSNEAKNLVVHGEAVFAFYEDALSITEVSVERVDIQNLTTATPGEPVSPIGLAYSIDSASMDENGVLYLLNTTHSSIFRWDSGLQTYLQTISLPEPSNSVVYSPALERLYVNAPSRTLYRVDDLANTPLVQPFVNVPLAINKLIPMGSDLMALINGSWDSQWIYDSTGGLVRTPVDCCYTDFYLFDENLQRLYFDESWEEYLGGGLFGPITTGNLNSDPLALSPGGQLLIDKQGLVYDTQTMTAIDQLPNEVLAAGWNSGLQLFGIESPTVMDSSYTTIQAWNEYLSAANERVIKGAFDAFFVVGDELLVVSSIDGIPSFTLLSQQLKIVPPAALEAPSLSVEAFTAIAVELQWTDVQGEEEFVLEWKLATDVAWSSLAVTPSGTSSYVDASVTTGNVYHYRIKARNGSLNSDFSEVVVVDLVGAIDPRVDPTTINFIPDDVVISNADKVYLLSQNNDSIFVWDVKRQDWDPTIPLKGSPQYFSYSNEIDALYTLYSDGALNAINLKADNPLEFAFATLPADSKCGLIAAGAYVVTCDTSGAWESQRSFNQQGNQISVEEWRHPIAKGQWNASQSAFYHFRDTSSPNDLYRTPLDSNGILGYDQDSPYHSSTGISYPIRVKPDGSIVMLGSGRIYDATTLDHIDDLPAPIDDALWRADELVTLTGNSINLNKSPDYAADPQITLSSTVLRILPARGNRIVVVLTTDDDNTELLVLDASFKLIEKAIFQDGFEN